MPTKTPTVLLAEDDAGMLRLVQYSLKKEGYRVLVAEDGERAHEQRGGRLPRRRPLADLGAVRGQPRPASIRVDQEEREATRAGLPYHTAYTVSHVSQMVLQVAQRT